MPRFAANLSMMFQEVPFLERFAPGGCRRLRRASSFCSPMSTPKDAIAGGLERTA